MPGTKAYPHRGHRGLDPGDGPRAAAARGRAGARRAVRLVARPFLRPLCRLDLVRRPLLGRPRRALRRLHQPRRLRAPRLADGPRLRGRLAGDRRMEPRRSRRALTGIETPRRGAPGLFRPNRDSDSAFQGLGIPEFAIGVPGPATAIPTSSPRASSATGTPRTTPWTRSTPRPSSSTRSIAWPSSTTSSRGPRYPCRLGPIAQPPTPARRDELAQPRGRPSTSTSTRKAVADLSARGRSPRCGSALPAHASEAERRPQPPPRPPHPSLERDASTRGRPLRPGPRRVLEDPAPAGPGRRAAVAAHGLGRPWLPGDRASARSQRGGGHSARGHAAKPSTSWPGRPGHEATLAPAADGGGALCAAGLRVPARLVPRPGARPRRPRPGERSHAARARNRSASRVARPRAHRRDHRPLPRLASRLPSGSRARPRLWAHRRSARRAPRPSRPTTVSSRPWSARPAPRARRFARARTRTPADPGGRGPHGVGHHRSARAPRRPQRGRRPPGLLLPWQRGQRPLLRRRDRSRPVPWPARLR